MGSDWEMGEARVLSDPNPSSPLSPGRESGDAECESNRMVEMELDAARALADFAQRALVESRCERGESSKGEQGSGEKKGRKMIRSGSPSSSQGPKLSGSSDEKEAKRIRRILANRESARQTIRRRQVLRDELTKRVADLSLDNEKMKMEKELVMTEYLSLKDKNQQLKEQIAKTINPKMETGVGLGPPFAPSIWPSSPSNSWNNRHNYQEVVPPKIRSLKKLYVPPYSWFYPLIHQLSGYCPQYPHASSDRDEASPHKQRDPSPCSEAMNDISKAENPMLGSRVPSPDEGEPSTSTRYEPALKKCLDSHLLEKPQGVSILPRERLVDTSAAAEARRRRKELTKLKRDLYGRQFRTPN